MNSAQDLNSRYISPREPRIYVRVLRHIQEQIASGSLVPGDPTPTITSLCGKFGCTRQTVAKALRLLVDGGQLIRYPGLGYYVADEDDPAPQPPHSRKNHEHPGSPEAPLAATPVSVKELSNPTWSRR